MNQRTPDNAHIHLALYRITTLPEHTLPYRPAKTPHPQWLHAYLKQLQDELKLSHWNIKLDKEAVHPESLAEIQIAPGQNTATISLHDEWKTWTPNELRSTLVHELIHCHLNPINEIAEEHLTELPQNKTTHIKTSMAYMNERATDAIAELIAPHLSKPKNKKSSGRTLTASGVGAGSQHQKRKATSRTKVKKKNGNTKKKSPKKNRK